VGAERASRDIERAADPGRLARLAYTYIHILIVAGIIVVAVADELYLVHPSGSLELPALSAALGGPALYILGVAIFKRAVTGRFPLSHLVGLASIALLVPAAPHLAPLVLGTALLAVLVLVAAWETVSLHAFRPQEEA
jgi:low temperature requirement protein LtrA